MSENYKTEYKDYKDYTAIMISTDRMIFHEKSSVRARMIEYAKSYKELHIIIFSKKGFYSLKTLSPYNEVTWSSQRFHESSHLLLNASILSRYT